MWNAIPPRSTINVNCGQVTDGTTNQNPGALQQNVVNDINDRIMMRLTMKLHRVIQIIMFMQSNIVLMNRS